MSYSVRFIMGIVIGLAAPIVKMNLWSYMGWADLTLVERLAWAAYFGVLLGVWMLLFGSPIKNALPPKGP